MVGGCAPYCKPALEPPWRAFTPALSLASQWWGPQIGALLWQAGEFLRARDNTYCEGCWLTISSLTSANVTTLIFKVCQIFTYLKCASCHISVRDWQVGFWDPGWVEWDQEIMRDIIGGPLSLPCTKGHVPPMCSLILHMTHQYHHLLNHEPTFNFGHPKISQKLGRMGPGNNEGTS